MPSFSSSPETLGPTTSVRRYWKDVPSFSLISRTTAWLASFWSDPAATLRGWTRIITQLLIGLSHSPPPKYCSWDSGKPRLSTSVRILPTSMVWAAFTSISTPPVKSMPRLKPCHRIETTEITTSRPSIANAHQRYLTKSTLVVSGMNRSKGMGRTSRENRANLQGAGRPDKRRPPRVRDWPKVRFLLVFPL